MNTNTHCHVSSQNINGKIKCQFEQKVKPEFEYDGKQWCIFHLPIKSDISDSTPSEIEHQFNTYISDVIDEALSSEAKLDLSYVIFPKDLDWAKLKRAVKPLDVDFSHCKFLGTFILNKHGRFNNITFNHAEFHGDIILSGIHFSTVQFEHVKFYGKALLEHSTYTGGSFLYSEFFKEAVFEYSDFSGNSNYIFDNAKFYNTVSFKNAIFRRTNKMSFEKVTFDFTANFSHDNATGASSAIGEISFSGSTFNEVNFSNRPFSSKTDFSSCVFNKAPYFHGCVLHQHTIFPPQKNFKDTSSEKAEHAYRILYIAMTNLEAKNYESMFYALIQKSFLKNANIPKNIKMVSRLYGFFTNYGQSFLRPFLLGLLPTFIFFSILYAFLKTGVDYRANIDWDAIGNGMDCAFQQIVKPFSFYTSPSGTFISQLIQSHPVIFKIICSLQTILSMIFITLILLALRWKFKRD